MRKGFMVFSVCLLALASCRVDSSSSSKSSSEETSTGIVADAESLIYFNTAKTASYSVNPFLYGTFIEHIEQCIYNGIWAELILDRKFFAPIAEDVSQWKKGEGQIVESISDNVYSPGYAVRMNAGNSIFQRGLNIDAKDYSGYFYAFGDGDLLVTLRNSNETIQKTLTVQENQYTRFDYAFASSFRNSKTEISFAVTRGTVTFDSVSLMPSDNYKGMRSDTLAQLKKLNATLYRWPGGNFVSGYDFSDGIGDRDRRPTKRNLNYVGQLSDFSSNSERLVNDLMKIGSLGFYGAFEPNDFGIDEFIAFCRYLGAEPNIVLNSGLGTVQEAVDEVAYCNATSGTYVNLRPQSSPYAIRYFTIGNEMNGNWQLGHMPISQYIAKHNAIAQAIKAVDPNITVLGVGDNASNWSREIIAGTQGNMDLISEHFYAERKESSVSEHILSMKGQAENRISNHRAIPGAGSIKISFDEYAYLNAEVSSRLKDGMGVASAMNVFLKNSDVVAMACYSSTVNATQGSLATTDYTAFLEGNGYVLRLYRNHMLSQYLPLTFNKREVNGYFEVFGTISQDKKTIALSVINTSDQSVKISHPLFKTIQRINYVTADYLESSNGDSQQELHEEEIINPSAAVVSPRSVSIITIGL